MASCCDGDRPQILCVAGEIDSGVPAGVMGNLDGVPTYIAKPCGSAAEGVAICVISDVFGINLVNSKLWCDAVAAKTGITVYLPDFHSGESLPITPFTFLIERPVGMCGGVAKTFKLLGSLPTLIPWMRRHGDAATLPILDKVFSVLTSGGTRVAVAGFCWGGRYTSMLASEAGTRIVAAVHAHPSGLFKDWDVLVKVPTLLIVPETDMMFAPPAAKKAMATLERVLPGKCTLEVFKGTEHGFAVRGGVSIPAVAEARARALQAAATFFVTHLLG